MIRSSFFLFAAALYSILMAVPSVVTAQGEHRVISATDTTQRAAEHGTHQSATTPEDSSGEQSEKHGSVIAHVLEHKVVDTPYLDEYPFPKLYLPKIEPVAIAGMKFDFSFTRHLIYLWLSAVITVVLLWLAVRQNSKRRVPRGFGNMIEAVVVFVRDEVAVPVFGKDAKRFLPVLLTFFFFIAITNLLGLIPYGATATGNINMTAALALLSFGIMIGGGILKNGLFGYFKGLLPHGVPVALQPLMFVIEVIGLFTKPFALCVRLFANMLSGGLVIGAFYALIFGLHSFIVVPVSISFLLFMTLLKLFVCLLQAYIFTMLSAFFIGMSVHQTH